MKSCFHPQLKLALVIVICLESFLFGQNAVTRISVSSNTVVLSWDSWAEKYIAESRVSLATGEWQFAGEVVGTNVNALSRTSNCQFVRIREVRQIEFSDPVLDPALRVALVIKYAPTNAFYDIDLLGVTNLNLAGWGITNISGLEFAKSLTDLDIGHRYPPFSQNAISDISPLAPLTNLTILRLGNNYIQDISALSRLVKLETLDLFRNNVVEISALSNLTSLSSLNMNQNEVTDLAPLSTLTNLQWLDMGHNQISNIAPLATLMVLNYLSLQQNPVTNISPLVGLANLKTLFLSENPGIICEPVSQMTNLTDLSLSSADISDIGFLAPLEKLEYLYLGWNPITNIDVLAGLTNLNQVFLYDTSVSNLAALVTNSINGGLKVGAELHLHGCPLTDYAISNEIPFLRAQGITVIQ